MPGLFLIVKARLTGKEESGMSRPSGNRNTVTELQAAREALSGAEGTDKVPAAHQRVIAAETNLAWAQRQRDTARTRRRAGITNDL